MDKRPFVPWKSPAFILLCASLVFVLADVALVWHLSKTATLSGHFDINARRLLSSLVIGFICVTAFAVAGVVVGIVETKKHGDAQFHVPLMLLQVCVWGAWGLLIMVITKGL